MILLAIACMLFVCAHTPLEPVPHVNRHCVQVLRKIVVRLYSEARDPAIFRFDPTDEAVLDFHLFGCTEPASFLKLAWLADINVGASSIPVLEYVVELAVAGCDSLSDELPPATVAAIQVRVLASVD